MSDHAAFHYDGKSSRRHPVTLRLDDAGKLLTVIHADGQERFFLWNQVTLSPRVGHTPRRLTFPDGAFCESEANDALDAWSARRAGETLPGRISRWERHWRFALPMLGVTALLVWLFIAQGIPLLAEMAVTAIPVAAEVSLGEHALATLDGQELFLPSRLDAATRQRFTALFRLVVHGESGIPYRLEFRHAPKLGANALAFPGGVVVVTDDLIALVREDAEFLGVAAHEAAHVRHRHTLRTVLQDALGTVLLAAIVGDAATLSFLSATLPTLLLDLSYSRDFERAADLAAIAFLEKTKRSPTSYGNMLTRLHERLPDHDLGDFWSDHPDLEQRLKSIRPGGES